nr:uncharacterized protein LOC117843112 [Setaria viridis]
MWSSQLHRERCTTNTDNRGLVRYPQRIGSRSYVAQAHVVRKKKVEGDPTSIDLFKNFHCSKMATPLQYRQPLLGWNKLSPNLETTNQRLLLKQWLKLSNLGYFGRLLAFTHPRRKGLGLVLCCR